MPLPLFVSVKVTKVLLLAFAGLVTDCCCCCCSAQFPRRSEEEERGGDVGLVLEIPPIRD